MYLGPLFDLKDRIEDQFAISNFTVEEEKRALKRYDAAIRHNFLPWMLVSLIRHPALQKLFRELQEDEPQASLDNTTLSAGTFPQKTSFIATYLNLDDETEVSTRQADAHPVMLYKFLLSANSNCLADSGDTVFVSKNVEDIYDYIGWKNIEDRYHSALPGLVVAGALELTSQVFIPVIADWMKELAFNPDLTYTDVHGEADIEHADLLLRAIAESYEPEEESREVLSIGIKLVEALLNRIFFE